MDLQCASEGVNVAIRQQGDVEVEPIVSVSRTSEDIDENTQDESRTSRDRDENAEDEISSITGEFRNVQIGEGSNLLYTRVSGTAEDSESDSIEEGRSTAEITTKDNLHFIINSRDGITQFGKCCIVLTLNFNSPLVERLLGEGDINVRLRSSDTLLEVQWSNWKEREETVRSRIKVEIITAYEEQKESFENDVLKMLLGTVEHVGLMDLIEQLYTRFGAMVEKLTGGCIEIWISNDNQRQLQTMRDRKKDLEKSLNGFLCPVDIRKGMQKYECAVTFLDDVPSVGISPKPFLYTETRLKRHQESVSREEMQTFVEKAVAKEVAKATQTRAPIPQRPIYHVTKKELLGIVWIELTENLRYRLEEIKKEGKLLARNSEKLITSLHETILKDLDGLLRYDQYIDLDRFKGNIYDDMTVLHRFVFKELEGLSAFEKDKLSETEENEFKASTKTSVDMCSNMIAAYAAEIVQPPRETQLTERLIKRMEDEEESTLERLIKRMEDEGESTLERRGGKVKPTDATEMRRRKEQLLQQATASQKEFLKQELDFYEINENLNSALPLGARVEPKSKRALLQASLQGSGEEASGGRAIVESAFGTIVNHVEEDEEQVLVHWDTPDATFQYHESNVILMKKEIPRKIFKEQQVGIGVYVEKSDTWPFEDQAGSVGIGTVIRHDVETGLVQVKWHGGVSGWNSYRITEDVQTRKECFIDGDVSDD